MARISKEEQARRDGMQWALRIAEKGGLDALRHECEIRGIHEEIPVGVSQKELQALSENVERCAVDCTLVMTLHTLIDEFDFTEEMCNRFKERYNSKTECLLSDYTTWSDIIVSLSEDINMKLEIRKREPIQLEG